MIRVALMQLRHRLGRALALLITIALATGSFVMLSGSVETTRLEVRGTVEANFRSTYDLLVRPPSSYTKLEREEGLVRPNYQSGIFGGISVDQVSAIRSVPGVEIAAPVANIGYVPVSGAVVVPMTPYLRGDTQQLFRIRPTWSMDRGTSRLVGAPIYAYVSRHPATVLPSVSYTRGDEYYRRDQPTAAEVVPGRRDPVPACTNYEIDKSGTLADSGRVDTPFGYRDPYATSGPSISCFYTGSSSGALSDGSTIGAGDPANIEVVIPVSFPVLLAAVDPEAETAMSGLDQALTAGRVLRGDDTVSDGADGNPVIPVLAASSTSVDQQVSATVERVRPADGELLSDALTGERGVVARVAKLSGAPAGTVDPVPAADTYRQALENPSFVQTYWTVGSSSYRPQPDGELRIVPVPEDETVYGSSESALGAPVGSDDTAVRPVSGRPFQPNQANYPGLGVVGQFDPTKILANSGISGLTSETYVAPALPGADPASRAALGGQLLIPSTNLGGYAAQPPTLLTTFAGAAPLLSSARYEGASAAAPISVVRVRVAGVTGPDPVSRERLNQVALSIGERTGLVVDIVAGASGVPTTVVLPAGEHGRPELRLREDWARKGVAYDVVDAVDRKSLALFVLILAVCGLVVGNAASAAVRTRRGELGVLSCLGWRRFQLFGVVQIEMIVIGLAAGLLGVTLAAGFAQMAGLVWSPARAALAVPAAVVLAALAGLAPAVRAGRAQPMEAIRPQVSVPKRPSIARSVLGFGVQALMRTRGRLILGAGGLAIGVAAATFIVAVQQVFQGVVVGSLLGDAVTLQVRTPDLLALVAIVLLGAAGVADVLLLGAREQAAELAVLRATGWTDGALSRVVLAQGLAMGVVGGLAGAILGSVAVALFVGTLPPILLLVGVGCAVGGVTVAVAAASVPATLIRRLPIAALVAEEG